MQSEPQCLPCVIKQSERIVNALFANNNHQGSAAKEEVLSEIRNQALTIASRLTLQDPPSKFTSQVLAKVYELLQLDDPYQLAKKKQNELGKSIYNHLVKELNRTLDPIYLAIKYAACGNVIDVGPAEIYSVYNPSSSVFDDIKAMAEKPLAIDDYEIFKEKFKSAEKILYILDNSGEIFLDKLLIERLKGPQIIIAVKALPILNDALRQDALYAGLDSLGPIINVNRQENDCRHLGVDFNCTSKEFDTAFESADIVVAKGHANFESLVDCERDCFFILMAKCPVVANKLKVNIKDRVFYYSPIKGE